MRKAALHFQTECLSLCGAKAPLGKGMFLQAKTVALTGHRLASLGGDGLNFGTKIPNCPNILG